MTAAYPLHWPESRPRTRWPERSRFKVASFAVARDSLLLELERLGAKYVVISTNIPLRQDGLPYATYRKPDDLGVAVYFQRDGKPMCFACDRYDRIEDNMHAIRLTIEALRGIARWGTGDMMEAAFRGFTALPDPTRKKTWREVLGFGPNEGVTLAQAQYRYRSLSMQRHPDRPGGSHDAMAELNAAMDEAERALS